MRHCLGGTDGGRSVRMSCCCVCITWVLFVLTAPLLSAAPPSGLPLPFFENYCMECHDAGSAEGDFDLQALSTADWGAEKNSDQWERVLERIRDSEMPPPKVKNLSSAEDRSPRELLGAQRDCWLASPSGIG